MSKLVRGDVTGSTDRAREKPRGMGPSWSLYNPTVRQQQELLEEHGLDPDKAAHVDLVVDGRVVPPGHSFVKEVDFDG